MSTNLTTIDFHGAKLIAIHGDKPETSMIAIRPVVENMGLDWEGQRQKIERHPVLSTCTFVIKAQLPNDSQEREHTFIALNRINFWLATIPPGRIKDPAVRQAVIVYQTELADVAFNHFFGKAIASGPHLSASQTGGVYKAVLNKRLAPLEQKVTYLAERLEQALSCYDPTAGFTTDYQPIIAVLTGKKVPSKGRRGLSARCSKRCERFLLSSGRGASIRISRETGRRLFQVDAMRDWLAAEGEAIIRGHMDRVIGQTAMALKPTRKMRAVPDAPRPFAKQPEAVS
ncbi:phage antirepressor N-terminal domain-containing protein [Kozakia baliensis]|uniref:phage antirepressor N-terminal domain-containing protein n=1 Tax=Kozakia baliensis TaxID=153496 RepID=UPI000495F291|nr:phage antirepressor N-terminal domain-containing protein [Kozakia baliensis]